MHLNRIKGFFVGLTSHGLQEMNSVSGARTADVIVAKAILDQPRSKRETPLLRSDTSEPKLRRYSQGKDRSYIKVRTMRTFFCWKMLARLPLFTSSSSLNFPF